VQIEPIDEHNVAHCVRLCQELHALGSFGQMGVEFVWDYTLWSLCNYMRDPKYYARCAVDDEGNYVGLVGGRLVTFHFSPKLMGIEDGWYVREGTPGRTKIAVRLMRGFVAWCLDEHGAILVQTGDIAAINSLAVDALYKHLGFTRFGTIYKYQRRS
jgi:hypothetical protein